MLPCLPLGRFCILFFLILFITIGFCSAKNGDYPTFYESVIVNKSYERLISPYEWNRNATTVYLNLPYLVLVSLDESRQTASYIVVVNITWNDPRLVFDPEEIGFEEVVIPSMLVWIPSISISNCIELKFMDRETPSNEVRIEPTGWVQLAMKGKFDTVCQCEVDNFPLDTQYCNINFDTGFTSSSNLILRPGEGVQVIIGQPEWEVSSPVLRVTPIPDDGTEFTLISATIRMKRNPQFYIYFLVIPTNTITVTCITALLLPLDITHGERVTLGISGLLGFTFMLGVIIAEVPRSTKLPLMGLWLIVQMFFCVVAMAWDLPIAVLHRCVQKWRRHGKCEQEKVKATLRICSCLIFVFSNMITTIIMFTTPGDREMPRNKIV